MHPALHTPLCDLLEIEYPIAQAGMGYVARGELAAAVSEAGGLGVIGAASISAKQLREEIHKVRDRTDRTFGVDVLFATMGRPVPSSSGGVAFATRARFGSFAAASFRTILLWQVASSIRMS